jgi:Transposase DNA-binding
VRSASGHDLLGYMIEPAEIAALVSVAKATDLGDARSRARLAAMMARAAANPSASFPKMMVTPSELEGAYRFFANPVVTPGAILASHFDATRSASANASTVSVVHDSSTIAFDPEGEREGLGRVRSSGQAFFCHLALVLTSDRVSSTPWPRCVQDVDPRRRARARGKGSLARWR